MLSLDAPHAFGVKKNVHETSDAQSHGVRHQGSALRPSSARATKSPRIGELSGFGPTGVQWQRDIAGRLSQLERRMLGPRLSDVAGHVWDDDCRRRCAEVQGSLDGVVNEMRLMARRIQGLEERILAQQTAAGQGMQRALEFEQQLLSLAQQSDHKFTSVEDLQKRHAGKVRLMDQTIDSALQRLSQAEERLSRQLAHSGRTLSLESRLEVLERRHQGLSATELASRLLTGGVASSDGDLQALEERVAEQSRGLSLSNEMLSLKVDNLMQQITLLASGDVLGAVTSGVQTGGMSGVVDLDVAELQRRLATLETQAPVSDIDDSDGQPQDVIRDLVEQVGRLKHQATSDEATLFGVEKRLQQLQYTVQQCCRWTEQSSPLAMVTGDDEVKEVKDSVA